MQAIQPVMQSIPTLIPGPFLMLLILPTIPLLLFSAGARPPDTSSLPFSTNDIFQTSALMSVAGAVILCVGVYPGVFEGVKDWIVDARGISVPAWAGGKTFPGLAARRGLGYGRGRDVHFQHKQRGVVVNRAAIYAKQHLQKLREGTFRRWYSSSKPTPTSAIFFILLSILLLVVLAGNVIRAGCEKDISKIPSWVDRILQKTEEEDETKIQIKVKSEISKRPENEVAILDVELRARGLKGAKKEKKETRKDESMGRESKKPSSEDKKGELSDESKRKAEKAGKEQVSTTKKKTFGSRFRKVIMGDRLAAAMDREVQVPVTGIQAVKSGPGWTVADDTVAQAALARSTNNAQAMASRMAAQKG